MTDWTPPARPAELTEQRLIQAFLEGRFPVDSTLPGERELASQLGVTRPTLREALQRLARDGWITIRHGKPTRVNDFWWEGNLNVLDAIVRFGRQIPDDFVPNLLAVRLALTPAYTRAAVMLQPQTVAEILFRYPELDESAAIFATADWELHLALIRASGNPIYMLIFNGFTSFYVEMATPYFALAETRASSRKWYTALLAAAQNADAETAGQVTQQAMQESITLWRNLISAN